MMRLTKSNIAFVNVRFLNGNIESVAVVMKSRAVSDMRYYKGDDILNLPASVKAFTSDPARQMIPRWELGHIIGVQFK